MKKALLLITMMSSFLCFSQENTTEFYVVVKPNESIEPSSKSMNTNGNLSLNFSQANLQNYFSGKNVLRYEKAFPTAVTPILQRTYILSISNSHGVNDIELKNVFNINNQRVESVFTLEKGGLLYEPDDYYFNGHPLSQLDLIRAPLAWEITKGSPNVVIGISDEAVDVTHEDLASKIIEYFGQPTTDMWSHGTVVATTAAGDTDNGKGIASIGYNSKLITHFGDVPYSSGSSTFIYMRRLLEVSQKPGVRVVNGSWYRGCSSNPIDAAVIKEIWDSGVLPVFAAGNGGQCGGAANYLYPQADGYSVVVTSVGHKNQHGIQFGGPEIMSVTDEHIAYFPNHPNINSHHHYDKIDLTAPGYEVVVGAGGNNYFASSGTSLASPIVAGAAALIFSLRPDFTPSQVENILKNTADDIYWIPGNDQFQGLLGTGKLNAFRAVKETKCMTEDNPKVDFMIKDSREDVGNEPNTKTQYMWTSSDIFVRNQNDGKLIPVHQNPTYDGVNPNYIYVRVTNNGCKTSSGNDTVTVNWAKANTSLAYPEYWDGSIVQNGVVFGGLVGTGTIPVLKPGQEAIVEIAWNVPNPQNYTSINSEPWHFCLLAKINSTDDPLSSPMTSNPNIMVRNNNNLAWKNITVINLGNLNPNIGAAFAVTNPHNQVKNYYLELVKEDKETGKAIYEEAEVGITMDDTLVAAWNRGGGSSSNVTTTKTIGKVIAAGNKVILNNLNLNPNEMGTVYLSFNFLTKEATNKEKFRYHVIQKDSDTDEILGGESFDIVKIDRPAFVADAGGLIEAEKNQPITISATDINEDATYNWYDEAGNLIYSGKNFNISNEFTTKYKLEVVALDGFKDYSEVTVKVTPFKLISMAPNPASTNVTIAYDIANSSSAYITIVGLTNNISNNYLLDTTSTQKTLSLNQIPAGQYSVVLVVDGKIVSAKNLIKN